MVRQDLKFYPVCFPNTVVLEASGISGSVRKTLVWLPRSISHSSEEIHPFSRNLLSVVQIGIYCTIRCLVSNFRDAEFLRIFYCPEDQGLQSNSKIAGCELEVWE